MSQPVSPGAVRGEWNRAEAESRAPYANLDGSIPASGDLTPAQQRQIEQALASDDEFGKIVQQRAKAVVDATSAGGTVVSATTAPSDRSRTRGANVAPTPEDIANVELLSLDFQDDLISAENEESEKVANGGADKGVGVAAAFAAAKRVVAVVSRCVRRFRNRRDHGFQATVVEETLREFFLTKRLGRDVWAEMKHDIASAFANQDSAGNMLLNEMKRLDDDNLLGTVTLVVHSAGCIYLCEFLDRAADTLPAARLFNVVFLAPAVGFERFARTLEKARGQIAKFRLFGMRDANEKAEFLIDFPDQLGAFNAVARRLYPGSLLYFVSGWLEGDPDSSTDYDFPIVGMQRYQMLGTTNSPFADTTVFPAIAAVYKFIGKTFPCVWSKEEEQNGLRSTSVTHGGFDDDPPTLTSLQYIIGTEWK